MPSLAKLGTFEAMDDTFDEDEARRLVGKRLLIGVTYLDEAGEPADSEQFHGVVEEADADRGILLILEGAREGEQYWLPPDLSALRPAAPGEYKLRSTGEVVSNPDFVGSWSVSAAPEEDE